MRYLLLFAIFSVGSLHAKKKMKVYWKYEGETIPFTKKNEPLSVGRLYEILYELDALFEKHGITYWMTDGTLLGAVRHGGYIPWDNDADLCVLSSDMNKAIKLINQGAAGNIRAFTRYKTGKIQQVEIKDRSWKRDDPRILLFPMVRDRKLGGMITATDIPRKTWPDQYFWREDEIYPIKWMRFGPIMLASPRDTAAYLDRHYGPKALTRVIGGPYSFKPVNEYPPALYDFKNSPIFVDQCKNDPYFLDGKKVKGYRKLVMRKK